MVDLSRLMQDAAILEVIDKSADEASTLSAQNSYQAMRIEELEQQLAERDALKRHADKMANAIQFGDMAILTVAKAAAESYRRAYPMEGK